MITLNDFFEVVSVKVKNKVIVYVYDESLIDSTEIEKEEFYFSLGTNQCLKLKCFLKEEFANARVESFEIKEDRINIFIEKANQ